MNVPSRIRRLLLAAGFAAAVLGAVSGSGAAVGADPAPLKSQPLVLPTATPGAAPAVPLTLDRVEVAEVRGTQATLIVRGSSPTILSHTLRRVDGVGGSTGGLPSPAYYSEHRVPLVNLDSNTTYEVAVYALNAAGQHAVATRRFTTLKQRVRVILREINITRDGDVFWTKGEPMWWMRLTWAGGSAGACYPIKAGTCATEGHGEGRIFPRNSLGQPLMWLFAEENFDKMPLTFSIAAAAEEYDVAVSNPFALLINCLETDGCPTGDEFSFSGQTWRLPEGREFASTSISLDASNYPQGFESTMAFTFELFHDNLSYPSPRNRPQSTWER